jgi:hypothetical protein
MWTLHSVFHTPLQTHNDAIRLQPAAINLKCKTELLETQNSYWLMRHT